jgi:hypothetical protein
VFLGMLAPRPSLAAEAVSPRFDVTHLKGTDECPGPDALASAVAQVVESDPPDASPERIAAVRIEVTFSRAGSDYVVTVRSGPLATERSIVGHGPTCASVADALVAAVVVLLDGMTDDDAGPSSPPAAAPRSHAAPVRARPYPPATELPDAEPSEPGDRAAADELSDRIARNVLFFEILGSGIGNSINYERFVAGDFGSVRVGFGYAQSKPPTGRDGQQWTLPVLFQLESSMTGSHNFHLAAGGTLVYRDGPIQDGWSNPENTGFRDPSPSGAFNALANVAGGYRYLPRRGGFTFGFVVMTLFNASWGTLWAGANAGVTF